MHAAPLFTCDIVKFIILKIKSSTKNDILKKKMQKMRILNKLLKNKLVKYCDKVNL